MRVLFSVMVLVSSAAAADDPKPEATTYKVVYTDKRVWVGDGTPAQVKDVPLAPAGAGWTKAGDAVLTAAAVETLKLPDGMVGAKLIVYTKALPATKDGDLPVAVFIVTPDGPKGRMVAVTAAVTVRTADDKVLSADKQVQVAAVFYLRLFATACHKANGTGGDD